MVLSPHGVRLVPVARTCLGRGGWVNYVTTQRVAHGRAARGRAVPDAESPWPWATATGRTSGPHTVGVHLALMPYVALPLTLAPALPPDPSSDPKPKPKSNSTPGPGAAHIARARGHLQRREATSLAPRVRGARGCAASPSGPWGSTRTCSARAASVGAGWLAVYIHPLFRNSENYRWFGFSLYMSIFSHRELF